MLSPRRACRKPGSNTFNVDLDGKAYTYTNIMYTDQQRADSRDAVVEKEFKG
jgi:hypothetical protein